MNKTKKVLNVGGNNKNIALPPQYKGWEHVLLDIDPTGKPDVVCDARELSTLPANTYDAVYNSHNLEHFFAHDVPKVLAGFLHVLNDEGFAHIRVPDMGSLFKTIIEKNLDIEDILYHSPAGPIMVKDVIYGLGKQIEQSGVSFYAHKTGFTQKSLEKILRQCGFSYVFVGTANREIKAIAFKQKPTQDTIKLFNLSFR